MTHGYAEIAFTDTVKRVQEKQGSRRSYARMDGDVETNVRLSEREAAFIAARDSFYMATVGETGWPYMQHRGGPPGFVKLLDDRTLGLADFQGNRQYVTVGNLLTDDRVSLFFMDYANRARLKMYGRAQTTEDPATLKRLAPPDYPARVERGILIAVEAFDWNCPQHITRRFAEDDVARAILPLQQRIEELEARLNASATA